MVETTDTLATLAALVAVGITDTHIGGTVKNIDLVNDHAARVKAEIGEKQYVIMIERV